MHMVKDTFKLSFELSKTTRPGPEHGYMSSRLRGEA